jgi:hypothetical protein
MAEAADLEPISHFVRVNVQGVPRSPQIVIVKGARNEMDARHMAREFICPFPDGLSQEQINQALEEETQLDDPIPTIYVDYENGEPFATFS